MIKKLLKILNYSIKMTKLFDLMQVKAINSSIVYLFQFFFFNLQRIGLAKNVQLQFSKQSLTLISNALMRYSSI